jgi:hypothetical protein
MEEVEEGFLWEEAGMGCRMKEKRAAMGGDGAVGGGHGRRREGGNHGRRREETGAVLSGRRDGGTPWEEETRCAG